MTKRMLIDALHAEETRVAIADEKQIYDFDFVSASKKQLKGNIYLAKITRVEPSLQAAFVEYGGGKQGFLPFSEIHTDYYQIPVSDRKRLQEEAARAADESSDAPQETNEQPQAEQPDDVPEVAESNNEQTSHALPLAPAIEELPASELEDTHEQPAYMQEAIPDVAISEDAPLPEQAPETADTVTAEASDMAPEPTADSEVPAEAKTGEPAESVETIANDEEEIQQTRKKRNNFARRYKIQEVIRRGQVVLVQVIKEERGNKGASLTTYLSLPGRYCVLMPNSPKDGGVSRKIASSEDRKRLKAIYTELKLAQGMSVIIRTAGMDRTRAEIKRDYDYLVKLWNRIREDTLKSNAPALIYEESDIIKRAVRDQYTNDIDEIVIEGNEGYEAAKDFMKLLLPSHTPKIKHYSEATPLFYAYDIEDQLLSMHDPIVKLRSGGYIVINPTEALISIDVNSGRATGERNIEETAAKTNLEAAVEVARQLRLRDLAGLIVIDFIDMLESRNRRAVEKALKDALKMDRAKIQLGRISPFGLLEMSRQRLRPSISETNMVQCAHCTGRGVIRSNESMSIQLIRALEKEASSGNWSGLRLIVPQTVGLHLLNTKRDALRSIEQRHNITIQVLIDSELASSDFNLEKMRRSQQGRGPDRNRQRPEQTKRDDAPIMADAILEEMGSAPSEGNIEFVEHEGGSETTSPNDEYKGGRNRERGRRGRRGRGGRGRDRGDRPPRDNNAPDIVSVDGTAAPSSDTGIVSDDAPSNDNQQKSDRPRRERGERGGRGRRRWREQGDRGPRPQRNNNGESSENQPQSWPQEVSAVATGTGSSLPAFATQDPIPMEPPVPYRSKPEVAPVLESTPRDPNKPAKKGWWQKMIVIDD